jgi:uncharacterized protein (DUF58 family)
MSGAGLRANAFVLIVCAVLLAVVGDWEPAFAGLWRLPAIFLFLGLAYESWIVSKISLAVETAVPKILYLGRAAEIHIHCAHTLERTVGLEFAPAAPDFFDMQDTVEPARIGAGAPAVIVRRVIAKRLGQFSWPKPRARVAGPLGLAWWPKQTTGKVVAVRVVPDLFRTASEVKGAAALGSRAGISLGGGTEVLRLRDYRPGDPPRVIDWKATARADRLISREFAQEDGLQIVIALDAGRSSALRAGSLDRFGHYVNVAARLAQYAAEREDSVGLLIYADRPLAAMAPARGAAGVARLRALLASSRIEAAESNPLYAATRIRSLVRHRSLIVMLTDIDDTTAQSPLAHAVRFLLPKHLPFVAGLSSSEVESMARAASRSWLDPYRSLAAQEYVVGLERKVRALRSLGAPALVAKPEQLENAVFAAYTDFRQRRSA